ncbi:hypothetical protein L3X38_018390 [Prunus dulcis]|uniref:Uncharacterized protein n=1 Tax=Prunus dulcis TaxID=3755 RepID=A0AAD4W9X2_PRUDU|nr:hypothetical protein L3X38_018390 [Prunus dulcis]
MLGCKLADTPIEMNHKLCEGMDQEPTNKEQYQRLVGRLIYLAHTRRDIAYARPSEAISILYRILESHFYSIAHALRIKEEAITNLTDLLKKETRVVLSVKMVSQQQTKDSGSKKLGMVAPQDKSSKEMKSSKKMKFASSSAETEPTS